MEYAPTLAIYTNLLAAGTEWVTEQTWHNALQVLQGLGLPGLPS